MVPAKSRLARIPRAIDFCLLRCHSHGAVKADHLAIQHRVPDDVLDERRKLVGAPQPRRKWDLAKKGQVSGVILVTYDHHSRGINNALTELQHEFPDAVSATMHIHLSKHTCLEVIAFKGGADRVRTLAKTLQSQKGVLDLKVIAAPD